jgi:hypothetical protein
MFFHRALSVCLLCCASAVALSGCSGPGDGRMEVSGTVLFKGSPLQDAQIFFHSLEEPGPPYGAQIVNGAYKVDRAHGLKPGKYLVRITAGDGRTPADEEAGAPGGTANIVSADRIPPDWNRESKQEVVVKPDESNKFDFNIQEASKPPR